jgi:hypothetical protein
VTSWVLLEYQMLIGPCALAALLAEMAPPPPQAAKPKVNVMAAVAAGIIRDFIVFPYCWGSIPGGPLVQRWAQTSQCADGLHVVG